MGPQNGKCAETARGVFRNEGASRSRLELRVLTGVRGYILIWSSDGVHNGGYGGAISEVGWLVCWSK